MCAILYVPIGSSAKYAEAGWSKQFSKVKQGELKEAQVEDLRYAYSTGENDATVINDNGYGGRPEEINVPAKVTIDGKEYDVTTIGASAFQNYYRTRSVTIAEGIESIEDAAFACMSDLEKLVLPSTLKSIGTNVIDGSSNLLAVISHINNPFTIDDKTFICHGNWNEETQTSEVFPSSATLYVPVGKSSLYEKAGWSKQFAKVDEGEYKEAVVGGLRYAYSTGGNEATVIRDANYYSLTEIEIPSTVAIEGKTYNVTAIGNGAFQSFNRIKSVIIHDGIQSIGEYAFAFMLKLKKLEIPSSVMNIGQCIVLLDEDLSTIVSNIAQPFPIDEKTFALSTNWNYKTQTTEYFPTFATLYIPAGTSTLYEKAGWMKQFDVVEDGVPNEAKSGALRYAYKTNSDEATVIWDDSYESLKYVDIPATVTIEGKVYKVTSVGSHAFKGCTNIESVTLHEGLASIGNYSFYELRPDYYTLLGGIRDIKLPSTLKTIGTRAFSKCYGLKLLTLPEGVETLKDYAFDDMALRRLELPNSLKSIGHNVISSNGYLADIVSHITDPFKINDYTFSTLSDNGSEPYGATLFVPVGQSAKYAEAGWSKQFAKVEEGEQKDVRIGSLLYVYSTGGTEATVIKDENNSYQYLTSVNVPATIDIEGKTYKVTSIDHNTFEKCAGLSSVYLSEGITSIGDDAFDRCTSLASVYLPEGLVSIGICAFMNCDNLQEIILPSTLKYIGGSAFNDCDQLKAIVIPEGIESLEGSTFYYSGLTRLELPKSLKEIGEHQICYCDNLKSVVSHITDPFAISDFTFSYIPHWNIEPAQEEISPSPATLYVPSNTADLYRNAPGWNHFAAIEEMVTDIPGDANNDEKVDNKDVEAIASFIMTGDIRGFNSKNAHGGKEGKITVADIVKILNKIKNKNQ